jgi:hypothetical protein
MNRELSYDERKEWAQMLYTRHDNTIKDIALAVGADEVAIRSWVHEGAWEAIKQSLLISKAAQLELYYSQLGKITTRLNEDNDANPKNMDLVVKYTTAIKNLETDVSISTIIEVSELFILWLRRKDITLTRKLIVHFDAFVKERLVN